MSHETRSLLPFPDFQRIIAARLRGKLSRARFVLGSEAHPERVAIDFVNTPNHLPILHRGWSYEPNVFGTSRRGQPKGPVLAHAQLLADDVVLILDVESCRLDVLLQIRLAVPLAGYKQPGALQAFQLLAVFFNGPTDLPAIAEPESCKQQCG